MRKSTHNGLHLITAALLVSSLGLGNVVAQASGVVLKPMRTVKPETIRRVNPRMVVIKEHLRCKVWGEPAEFPDSVLLTNDGAAVIVVGTRVHYYVTRGGRPSGNYTFTKALRRGTSVYAPLPGGSARGAACTVSFVVAPTHPQVRRPQVMKGAVANTHQIVGRFTPIHVLCVTAGEGEFVRYVMLTNDRPRPIPTGTTIHYFFSAKYQGNYTFTAPLYMNQRVSFKLSYATSPGWPCSVTFLK